MKDDVRIHWPLFFKMLAVMCLPFFALLMPTPWDVSAGEVGIKRYLLGSENGVDIQELGPGRYWLRGNEEFYVFPTSTQNYTWAKAPVDDDDATDESITFQTDRGLTVNADVGIRYAVDRSKVTTLFHKYRQGMSEIRDVYLRNMVRDALITEASTRQIETVYGADKADLLAAVEKRVRAEVEPLGINIERLYWAGELRLPPTVTNAINEAEAIRIKNDAFRKNPRLVELPAIQKRN